MANEAQPEAKTVIGYIHPGMVHEVFMRSLFKLMVYEYAAKRPLYLTGIKGAFHYENRNDVVRQFLTTPAEWLFFVDTDIELPPNSLEKLMEVADPVELPIVSGLYYIHSGPRQNLDETPKLHIGPAWYRGDEHRGFTEVLEIDTSRAVPIDICGMGVCLIHRSVLEAFLAEGSPYAKTAAPWFFHDEYQPDGAEKPLIMGEDFTFCTRAAKLGFSLWGYAGLQVNHYKTRAENAESYLAQFKPGEITALRSDSIAA